MKVLVLSFYYAPDLSAGAFRTTALVEALLRQMPKGSHVELITTLPNRYSTFTAEAPQLEEHPKLKVHRVALPPHKSGMVDQSRAFISYAAAALRIARKERYNLVFATSSRLMTAVLGALISRRKGVPLYLDIRDIFVDTIGDVLPGRFVVVARPFFSFLERWTVGSARKINLVSGGFLSYFKDRYPEGAYSFFTNGIDDVFIKEGLGGETPCSRENVVEVLYAGNIGEGQGLHIILPSLAKKFAGRLRFKIIGDGGRKAQLLEAIERSACENIEILPPVPRSQLIDAYRSADVLFLHLNSHDAFKKVLPSKLFEYAAIGKPIWAGVAGYAADFVAENIDNAVVFAPGDVDGAVEAFGRLSVVTRPRDEFVRKFSRAAIMKEMADDVLSVIEKK